MSFIIDTIAGLLCGIISGFGIGGGTLLVIYMTNFADIAQSTAQGINLIYFLPTSSGALFSHFRRKLIHPMVIWSILAGIVTTAIGAYTANIIQSDLLEKHTVYFYCISVFVNCSQNDKSSVNLLL